MATLHIENFPDDLYAALRDRARREHRSVAQEIIQLLGQALENDESLSILDLQGLGRDLWDGVDAADYVLRERDAWDCLAPAAPSPAHRRFGRFPGSPIAIRADNAGRLQCPRTRFTHLNLRRVR